MSDPLLTIRNHHAAFCGDPPIVDGSAENCYMGYFENPYGEQWIFTLDRKTGKATLRGGDVGWNSELNVVDGHVAELLLGQGGAAVASSMLAVSITAQKVRLKDLRFTVSDSPGLSHDLWVFPVS